MQSMEEIYQEYAQVVFKFLFSKTRDEDLAEELTQETFYQAVRCIDRFDGSCKISTWLCGIAKNQLKTWQRKHPDMEELTPETQSLPSAEADVMASMSRVELMKKLHACPEPFREIMYLRIFGNLSFKEIGVVMGKSENWARVNFYRGKQSLQKELKNQIDS